MIARWYSGLAAACVLIAAAFLAGCNNSYTTTTSGPATTSSAGTSAVCQSVQRLKASIAGLKDVNITANGTSAVSAQFTKIKQDFNAVKANAKGQFQPQVNALSGAMDTLGSSLNAAKASVNAGTLSALASAAGSVVTAGTNLVTAVSSTC